MNETNLVPFSEWDEEDHRRISSKAGRRSGEVRSGRKKLKETLIEMLEDEDLQEQVCSALIRRAAKGDYRAFGMLRDSIGESPLIRAEVSRGIDGETFFEEHKESLRKLMEIESANNVPQENSVTALLTYEQRMELLSEMIDAETVTKP